MCTSKKRAFLCGWLCQFGLMPLMSQWQGPSPNEVIGLILCGCAPAHLQPLHVLGARQCLALNLHVGGVDDLRYAATPAQPRACEVATPSETMPGARARSS